MAKSSASRSGCHIGVMLKPQPNLMRSVRWARCTLRSRIFGMHSVPSLWKWCSAIQKVS